MKEREGTIIHFLFSLWSIVLRTLQNDACDQFIESRGSVMVEHYATSRKAAGSRPYAVNAFFSTYLILPAALGPRVYSALNRNEYQKNKNNVSRE
jgi:hypothetical protein